MSKMDRLNGKNLYYMFMAGASRMLDAQAEINRINVFPVADADTGTNMASTMRMVMDNIEPDSSFKVTVDSIGVAALAGARGNSGIIFAQFLYGLSEEIHDCPEITIKEFAESLKRSVKYLYEAVANPVEGTILTVIREWVEYIHEHNHLFDDFARLMTSSYEAAKKSLAETKHKLAELTKANVVDAGAKGFVVFLEGMKDLVVKKNIKKYISLSADIKPVITLEDIPDSVPDKRYCTEAMLENVIIDKERIKDLLSSFGDSVVVAGSASRTRIHVHTSGPAALFKKLRDYGTITFQKVEDMLRQYESAHNRKYNIALVTDSTCDLPDEFIEKYQVHVVPINMVVDGHTYLDGLTLEANEFYRLAEKSREVPVTSQPSPSTFVNLYSQLASRYDSVIALHLSSGLSGTCQTSITAAQKVSEEMNKKIDVIDTGTISGAVGLQVKQIASLIEQGLDHDEIVRQARINKRNSSIFVSVKTLKYFVRSGRVNPLKGNIARLLKVKPVVSMGDDGKAVLLDKSFSYKTNRRKVIENVKKSLKGRSLIGYSVNHSLSPDDAGYFVRKMIELTGKEPDFVSTVSPSLGNHTGRGTVAVTLLRSSANDSTIVIPIPNKRERDL